MLGSHRVRAVTSVWVAPRKPSGLDPPGPAMTAPAATRDGPPIRVVADPLPSPDARDPADYDDFVAATQRDVSRLRALAGGLGVILVVTVFALLLWSGDEHRMVAEPASTGGDTPTPGDLDSSAVSNAVVAWLVVNTTAETSLLSPADLAPRLADGLPDRTVATYEQVDPRAGAPVDLLVVTSALGRLPANAPARRIAANSVLVASFGPDLEIRQAVPSGQTWAEEQGARRASGAELAANPSLAFTPGADAAVRAGRLDARLLIVLAGLAIDHALEVDVPVQSPVDEAVEPPNAPGRVVHVRSVDGRTIDDDPSAPQAVTRFIDAQAAQLTTPDVRVRRLAGKDVLVIRYPLPSPAGLLNGAGFTTKRSSS